MATGSYEESLSMEGIPDHHEASAFTRRRQRWSRQSSHPPTRTNQPKGGRTDSLQLPRRRERREGETEEIATGVSEARSHQRRGKKTPTLVHLLNSVARPKSTSLSVACRSAEAVFGRRETSGPPVSRAEPKTPRDVPAAKVARVNRERARCGCTQFGWVADIGWTHRVSSPPGGRKACW
jgi:hypothetical protein